MNYKRQSYMKWKCKKLRTRVSAKMQYVPVNKFKRVDSYTTPTNPALQSNVQPLIQKM